LQNWQFSVEINHALNFYGYVGPIGCTSENEFDATVPRCWNLTNLAGPIVLMHLCKMMENCTMGLQS